MLKPMGFRCSVRGIQMPRGGTAAMKSGLAGNHRAVAGNPSWGYNGTFTTIY